MQQKREDSVQTFKRFLTELSQKNVQQLLQKAEQLYAVRQFKITQLTVSMAEEIYQNIYIKLNRNFIPLSELNWWENQLRIFVWVMVLYVELKNTKIQQLNNQDWQFFSSIFPNKKTILFQYQSINILKEHGQAKKWTPDQDQLFVRLFNDKGLKCKWSQLAKLLYIDSNKLFFRTPKQCRQRWLNHLDPSKSKSEWSLREDYILIRYVYQKQKKWAEISKLLHNKRNEHSIKNRFKSLITKQQKFHRQKVDEPQLIKGVYKRYFVHFHRSSTNRVDETLEPFRSIKTDGDKKLKSQQQNHRPESLENIRLISLKPQSQRLMFPFSWYPANRQEKSFVPYRKSEQYVPFNNFCNFNEKDLRNNLIGSNLSSIENIPGLNAQKCIQSSQNIMFSKYRSQIHPPNKSYLSEEYQNQNNQNYETENHRYTDMLNEPFVNENDLPLGSNYEQFLPMADQFEDSSNQGNGIFRDLQRQISMQAEEGCGMDEEEKRIRAEIFLMEDPFDLIKTFFYKKTSDNTEIKESI